MNTDKKRALKICVHSCPSVVSTRSNGSIAEKVLNLLNDPEQLQSRGRSFRTRALESFSVFESASELKKLYAELTARPNSDQ